jgi:SAM-dependent methyltransferase
MIYCMGAPRPPRVELADSFTHPGVARAYQYRPPYPDEVFDILLGLMDGLPGAVLDLGAGEGALARPLAARLPDGRVDAVDISPAMVEEGRGRPGGRAGNLRWTVAAAEECALDGPYGLVTAGASLHWMPWGAVLGRVAGALAPGGWLVVVEHGVRGEPWREPLVEVIRRHSRSRGHDPRFELVDALCEGGFLELVGRVETAPVTFRQPVGEYVEAHHSTSSLARELMPAEEAAAFGAAVVEAVRPWTVDGELELPVVATVSWGRPSGG